MDAETLLAAWQRDFPRLAEIRAGVHPLKKGTFFHGVPSPTGSQPSWDFYREIESDLSALDDRAWPLFREKLLNSDVGPNGLRGYSGAVNALTEAKSYRCLGQELARAGVAYDSILPIPEATKARRPDWGAYLNGELVGALEVKSFNESNVSLDRLDKNTEGLVKQGVINARRVDPGIPVKFWAKLKRSVDEARQQLDALSPGKAIPRFVLLVIRPDLDQRLAPVEIPTIAPFLNELNDGLFRVLHEIRS